MVTGRTQYALLTKHDQACREMAKEPGLHSGAYLGIVTQEVVQLDTLEEVKATFYHYQFSTVLQGSKDRYLHILLPTCPTNFSGHMYETRAKTVSEEPAFIAVGSYMDTIGTRDIADYFLQRYAVPVDAWEKYPMLVEWKPTYEYTEYPLLRYYPGPPGGWYAEGPLRRVVRSKARKVGAICLLPFTVLVDIISFPVQLVIVNERGWP